MLQKFDMFFKIHRIISSKNNSTSAASYRIMALYKPAENHDYGVLLDKIISDHIVVGMWDTSLSEQFKRNSDLNLK